MPDKEEGATDLDYEFITDERKNEVYIRFTGFENDEQIDDFLEFMKMNIRLIFAGGTIH